MWDDVGAELDSWGLSGTARVVGPDDVRLECCWGLADRANGRPVTPETRFGLASVTKLFTAATVLAVLPDVTVPVLSLLPAQRRPATLRPDVTVHHLLSHTSGIADYAEEEGPEEVDYATLWEDRPCYRFERPADFLPLFGDLPPYTPPGQRFRYCNAGFVLLGLVVEELTGLSFPDAVREHVFGPAGMERSGFFRLDDLPPDTAIGYQDSGRTNIYAMPVIGGGDGGAFATSADLDRFLRWDGLPAAMLVPRSEVDPGIDYGYGATLYSDGRFGHGGGDPGVATLIQALPAQDSTVVVLLNVEAGAVRVRDRLVEAVLA